MSRDEDVLRGAVGASERRDELVRVALTAGDQLDDIRRSKIWTRIEDRLDDRAPAPWRWLLAGGAGALAIAGIVMLVVARGHGPIDGFVAPPDATLTMTLGHAKAALVGPAKLDVLESGDRVTRLALRHGRLVAEFAGGQGRSLRIDAPGATIEIVGTLFAVDVHASGTCVSVAHGRVRMTTFTQVIFVEGGHEACTDAPAPHAIATEVRDALAHHEAALALAKPAPAPALVAEPAAPIAPPTMNERPGPGPGPGRGPASGPARGPGPGPDPRPRPGVGPSRAPAPEPPPHLAIVDAPVPVPAETPALAAAPTTTPQPAFGDPPPPSTANPTPAPSPPTAAELYHAAELALANHDTAAADRGLAKIVDDIPVSPLVDQALYERARIAYDRRAYADARRHLSRLAGIPTSPLREPGAYLDCRVAIASNDSTADACLASYRATYPHSPHDLDVLGLLVDRAFRAGGCARAAPLVDELTRLYQATTLARGWRERCP